jgi:hypothetical protein
MMLSWKLHERIQVELGPEFSYVFHARSSLETLVSRRKYYVGNMEASLMGGSRYVVNDHLDLCLYYSFGLTDIGNIDWGPEGVLVTKTRYGGVSLLYFFQKK